jgi:hypothetical protein
VSDTGPSAETLTIMMTDVEGSTDLRRIRGDRLADEILGLHGSIVRVQVGGCGGQERQLTSPSLWSCRRSSPGGTCGTASENLWPAALKRNRCCWCSRTCTGLTSTHCC